MLKIFSKNKNNNKNCPDKLNYYTTTVFYIPLFWPLKLLQNYLKCPLIGEKKRLNKPTRAENNARQTGCPLTTCPIFRKFFMEA